MKVDVQCVYCTVRARVGYQPITLLVFGFEARLLHRRRDYCSLLAGCKTAFSQRGITYGCDKRLLPFIAAVDSSKTSVGGIGLSGHVFGGEFT